jgi:hypothetical protein
MQSVEDPMALTSFISIGQELRHILQPLHEDKSTFIDKAETLLKPPKTAPNGHKYLHHIFPNIKTARITRMRVAKWIQTPNGMGFRL